MMQSEAERLLNMEEKLHEQIIGQDEAINAVADAIRRARSGLKDPKRPIGSFIFIGPSGVSGLFGGELFNMFSNPGYSGAYRRILNTLFRYGLG